MHGSASVIIIKKLFFFFCELHKQSDTLSWKLYYYYSKRSGRCRLLSVHRLPLHTTWPPTTIRRFPVEIVFVSESYKRRNMTPPRLSRPHNILYSEKRVQTRFRVPKLAIFLVRIFDDNFICQVNDKFHTWSTTAH